MPTPWQKRIDRALWAAILALGLMGAGRAATVALVSRDADGSPGAGHSGFLPPPRRTTVADDGAVVFISHAPLVADDTDVFVDVYRYSGGGPTAVDRRAPPLTNGNCHLACADQTAHKVYVFRQTLLAPPYEEYVTDGADKKHLSWLDVVYSVTVSGAGDVGAYESRGADGLKHIYLRDFDSGSLTAVTENADSGAGANGDSFDPVLSADGQRLVLSSKAFNLVSSDTNGRQDVFLYERASDDFTLVSQRLDNDNNADADAPAVSGDGRIVCFVSADESFVAGDTNAKSDVFAWANGAVERCSVASDGTQADGDSSSPRLNADGRFVVFTSRASNLVPDLNTNGVRQVYAWDREAKRIECLSVNSAGQAADADCFEPSVSPAGRYVAFASQATNLAVDADGAYYQVFRADRGADFANHPPTVRDAYFAGAKGEPLSMTLAAADPDGDPVSFVVTQLPANGVLTIDGGGAVNAGQTYGADTFPWLFTPTPPGVFTDSFAFKAADAVAESSEAQARLQMIDEDTGFVTRVSLAADGSEADAHSWYGAPRGLSLSAAGRLVAFTSSADLSGGSGIVDVYLRDVVAGTTTLVSANTADNKNAYHCVLSGDGCRVAYYTQDGRRLALRDLTTGGEIDVVTLAADPLRPPAVSHDGTRVAYEKDGRIYLYDAGRRADVEVSVNDLGASADAACEEPAISADGRVVAFCSTATNLVARGRAGVRSVFLRFVDQGLTVVASTAADGSVLPGGARKPALSVSGRFLAFLGGPNGDTLYRKNVMTDALAVVQEGVANPAISADGRFLCYTKSSQLCRYDTVLAQATLVSNAAGANANGVSYQGVLSADGRFVAFASDATDLVGDDGNGVRDVFLNDFSPVQNQLPTPSLAAKSVPEEQSLTDVAITCTDTENNDVVVEILSEPQHAASFSVSPIRPGRPDPVFSYTPVANYCGTDGFTYRCVDAGGASDPATVAINVTDVNDPPTLDPVDNSAVNEGETLSVSLTVADPDLTNPSPYTDQLSFTVTPEGCGQAAMDGRAGVTYTFTPPFDTVPRGGAPVEKTVTVRAQDLDGETAQQTFTVTVSDKNDVPDLTIDAVVVLDAQATEADITSDVVRVDDDDDVPAQIGILIVQAPTSGQLRSGAQVLQAEDEASYADFPLTYVAPAQGAGVDTVRIKAVDAGGGTSQEAELRIVFGDPRLEMTLQEGWNAFSLPFPPHEPDPEKLFARPGRSGAQTWYRKGVWLWDALLQVYRPIHVLEAGRGYYMYCADVPVDPIVVRIDGNAAVDATVSLLRRWNLVGPVGFGDLTDPLVCSRGKPFPEGRLWECTGSGCQAPPDGELRRGRAYWIVSPVQQPIEPELIHSE